MGFMEETSKLHGESGGPIEMIQSDDFSNFSDFSNQLLFRIKKLKTMTSI